MRGEAKHYYSFLPALQVQLIPNTTATHPITYTYPPLLSFVWQISCLALLALTVNTNVKSVGESSEDKLYKSWSETVSVSSMQPLRGVSGGILPS